MRKLETVRVNTRISLEANAWLDKRSIDSGISKSSLIQMAVEAYIESENGEVDEISERIERALEELEKINAKLRVLPIHDDD